MKLLSKKLFIIVVSLALCAPSSAFAQTLIDKILVIVNDDVITENDLEKRIARAQLTNEAASIDQNLRDRILKNMVEELVQTTKLKAVGLTIEDLRESMKTRSMLAKLIRSDAVRSIKVSDEEVDTFAKAYNIQANKPEYDVSFLLIESSDNVEQQEDLLKSVRSAKEQTQSSDLSQLSGVLANVQIDSSKKDLGFNPPENLPSIFASTLAKMASGDISEPIKTSKGIYVLKLNSIRGGLTPTEKRKAQHILIKAETPLEVEQAKQTLQRLLTQIRAGVEFENIAKFYSDDSGSAATGGELGWMRKGQTVPRFEAKLFSMKEGEISEPVVTNFGVHVIKLNEISKIADPDEQKKTVAYNNLMTQKVDQYES